jgi:hypothetical protein
LVRIPGGDEVLHPVRAVRGGGVVDAQDQVS